MAKYKNGLGEVVDAFELRKDFMEIGAECRGVPDWGITAYDEESIYFGATGECYIETKKGKRHVSVGDYIIRRENGELYSYKPGIFMKVYSKIEGKRLSGETEEGMLLAYQAVKEEMDTIKAELKRKGIEEPKGFSVLEQFVTDNINQLVKVFS